MANQIVWHDRFNIGVDIIDKEHKKLFSIMNRLMASAEQEARSRWVCQEGIKYFKGHALKHFTEEELYMASIGYKGFDTHRKLHDDFRKKVLPELERELEETDYAPDAVDHFLGVCAGWLIGHTLTEDHAITGKVSSKWENMLPEEQLKAMNKMIVQLVYDLFRLEARVISEHYGGERFGKGIYYCLKYSTEEGDTWEIFLVFEEKLLLETGKILGFQANKLNTMLMNVTRFVARQFVQEIKEHIPSSELYELEQEILLDYEQFREIFAKESLQVSLLLSTGAGYFAFCALAPHLVHDGQGIAIRAENAASEIKTYLKKNKERKEGRKKILIVDDSSVARYAMGELLGKDYQVTMVDSGMSALQSMALDRPDLVLLDYEMPVCDGRQVLDMIRAEKEFADISVIFLTSKVDKESVKKVLELKPSGYLLKTMQPVKIKKVIDDYMKKIS